MTPALRKIHRRVWILLAIILPLLCIAAIAVIPVQTNNDKLYQQPAATEEVELSDHPGQNQE